MKKCINCKSDNRNSDVYCRNCGCLIKKNGYYVLINILTFLVILGLLFVIALFIASYFVY